MFSLMFADVKQQSKTISNKVMLNLLHFHSLFTIFLTSILLLPEFTRSVCIHDHITKNKTITFVNDIEQHQRRLLQNLGYGPIRIYYEYNTTTVSDTDLVGRNLRKIMNIINQFWSRTLEVDYLPALSFEVNTNIDLNNYQCLTFTVPRRILQTPIANKDFGLLIEAEDDGDSGVTAYSYPCASSSVTKRPLWGFIHWNKRYLSFNPLNFQQNIHIGIHEVLHVLGFSQMLYTSYRNSQIFVNTPNGAYLNGPFIRRQLIRQYGCADPPGMSLQMNGGEGTALSHWSRKTASNQLMTAGVSVNNPTISYITLALLQETGWYRKVHKNLGKFINFGYRKGCSMLGPSNCTSNEYCRIQDEKKADYDRTSLGYCKNDSLSNCLYVKFYINFICTDPNYAQKSLHADQGVINITGEAGGAKSRLFQSDLRISGQSATKYSFRCYQTICSPTKRTLTLRVGKTFVFCLFPNQVVTVKGYTGTIRCPDSFQAICAIERCNQQCNANGICIGGRCLCDPNFNGPACSQLTSLGTASKMSSLTPSQNNNCIEGSYRSEFGDCVPCGKKCSRCNSQGCLQCLNEKLPVNGICK